MGSRSSWILFLVLMCVTVSVIAAGKTKNNFGIEMWEKFKIEKIISIKAVNLEIIKTDKGDRAVYGRNYFLMPGGSMKVVGIVDGNEEINKGQVLMKYELEGILQTKYIIKPNNAVDGTLFFFPAGDLIEIKALEQRRERERLEAEEKAKKEKLEKERIEREREKNDPAFKEKELVRKLLGLRK